MEDAVHHEHIQLRTHRDRSLEWLLNGAFLFHFDFIVKLSYQSTIWIYHMFSGTKAEAKDGLNRLEI